MGKITIIGAGNGGCTYAAYLGKRGHEVCLYEVPELADNLKDVIELGGFEMRGCKAGRTLSQKRTNCGAQPRFGVRCGGIPECVAGGGKSRRYYRGRDVFQHLCLPPISSQ